MQSSVCLFRKISKQVNKSWGNGGIRLYNKYIMVLSFSHCYLLIEATELPCKSVDILTFWCAESPAEGSSTHMIH